MNITAEKTTFLNFPR